METNEVFMFRDLELNKKMQQDTVCRNEEKNLFRHIRRELANHTVGSAAKFRAILRDLDNRCNAVNAQRIGRGPYLHVDGALPTDHSLGWIKLTYLDIPKAQATILLVHNRGEAQVERD